MLTEEQFIGLYNSHRAKTYSLCYRFSQTEAQDWTGDIFLKVWESRGSFRGMCKPSTWLHRIAINHCLMKTRSFKDRVFVVVEDHMKVVSPTQFNTVLVKELLGTMKEREASSMVRHVCGSSSNTVEERSLRYRGRQRAIRG